MEIKTEVSVTNHLGDIAKRLPQRLGQIVRKTGFDVAGGAQVRSRVDFGSMKAGWYVNTNRTSTYGDAVAAAKEANEDVEILPNVGTPEPLSALVANATAHAIHNEFGTVHMSAQPMLHPSADEHRPGFEAAVADALRQANG